MQKGKDFALFTEKPFANPIFVRIIDKSQPMRCMI